MTERWEYKVVYFSAEQWTRTGLPDDLNERFDEYGAQGWELVGSESLIRPRWIWTEKTVSIVAFFKRRVVAV
jgi:hypothetical protein